MFGFSLSEFGIIILLAILILRPKDFPIIVKKAGQWYGKWLRIYYGFVDEINDIVKTEETEKNTPQFTEKRGEDYDRNK